MPADRNGWFSVQADVQLADGKPHHVTELAKIKLISEAIDEALEDLVQEETITIEDGYLAAATPKGNRQ